MEHAAELAKLTGSEFVVISTAVHEMTRRDLPIEHYNIELSRNGNTMTVVFVDPKRPEGIRGSVGKLPEFEVELSPDGRHVLAASFVR